MARAISVHELLTKKRKVMDFEGEWLDMVGCPEMQGAWIIWGSSGSGKTRFSLQLAKYLTRFGKVAYNSLEEGDSESLARAFGEVGMEDVSKNIVLLEESIKELSERLSKQKSPKIIIIDSLQYTEMNYSSYKELRQKHKNKLFIFISHADGKSPAGRVAKSVRFDSFVKIFVKGYKAFPVSRYGGGETYTIWSEGAKRYWGDNKEENNI